MTPRIYHMHPLVAGPLESWSKTFARVATMGFSHVCLAPPFAPGACGDIFVHATFERFHPSLGFSGSVEAGLALAVQQAAHSGLEILLDIAPAQVAVDAPVRQHQPEWFAVAGADAPPDPRRAPTRLDAAIPRFDHTDFLDKVSGWWVQEMSRLLGAGIAGFRCLTLDRVPSTFWRRVISSCRELRQDALFLAWTPGLPINQINRLSGVDFDFTCSSAAWWDGRATWFADEHEALQKVAPSIAGTEPSFSQRLVERLSSDVDLATAYRLALRTAGAVGAGLFLPMGFEYATARRFDPVRANPAEMEAVRQEAPFDLANDIAAVNRSVQHLGPAHIFRYIGSPDRPLGAWLRSDAADIREAARATLIVINPDTVHPVTVPFSLDPLPPAAGAAFRPDTDTILDASLQPGEVRVVPYRRAPDVVGSGDVKLERAWAEHTRFAIEAVEPVVPDATPHVAFPAKTIVGQDVVVEADIIADGHDILAADLLWRADDGEAWHRISMHLVANDRWATSVRPDRVGLYRFAVEAWWDQWATFAHDLHAKAAAGQDVKLEIEEGRQLIERAVQRKTQASGDLSSVLASLSAGGERDAKVALLLSDTTRTAMKAADARPFTSRSAEYSLRVDRPAAIFASWYELFPRSATRDPKVSGTFRSVIERLPAIRDMGFDVLYFPPINPIGTINRKGRNNSLRAEPGDVGSPYAIGSAEGGHDAVHPELGTLDDFRALIAAAHAHGLELALDFAIQCAPDHPWVRDHKDWFRWRPDGSMRYAENPPKKYEDIVNPDFFNEHSFPAVWLALRDMIQFWVDQGIRIFRVDNPHTKPLPFWHWMISDIQSRHPDVLFLAEAFTRPKLMYRLAKVGFSQSYTYFTWRDTKRELTEYLTELTQPPAANFFRPNFFVNTPDINPIFLQQSGRPGFLIRAVLAATLSGLWGMYSGFEICEATPLPGREEYLDSEKYEIRPRDYGAPGNIVSEISTLNRLRRLHPALQTHLGLTFHAASNDQIILYKKGNILIAVSLDPHNPQEADIEVPLWQVGLSDDAQIGVTDLMRNESFTWYGKTQHLRLDPADQPFRIWQLSSSGIQ